MPNLPAQFLDEAIARQAAIVIGCRVDGQVRHLTSKFLGRQPTGIWVAVPSTDADLVAMLVSQRSAVAVAFKTNDVKHSFVAEAIARNASAVCAGAVPVDSLLLQRSVDVPNAQRRKEFRVLVTTSALSGKLYRIEDHVYFRDRPLPSQKLVVKLIDLSVGGMGVMAESPGEIDVNQRLRIELKFDDIELVMEGVVRHVSRAKRINGVRLGIQFRKLENDVVGRQSIAALTKIVGEIQRSEVRRARDVAVMPKAPPQPPTAES